MTIHEVGGCTIVQGDNLELLRLLPDNSVHTCVTDPPYGIGFMGKKWDTFKPGTGKVCDLMHSRERAAAKLISDNPNLNGRHRSPALSPSQIDYDRSLAGQREFQSWTEQWAREVLRVLRPGGHMLVCGAPRSYHRMASGVEDARFEIRDCIMWVFGQGFPKSHNLHGDWEGWGTAFKPAWEPILVARKPLEGTVAQNVAKYGTGALNIDGCRITTAGVNTSIARRKGAVNHLSDRPAAETEAEGRMASRQSPEAYRATRPGEELGRWPANLIHDGSDEVLECFPDAKGQLADASDTAPLAKTSNVYGAMARTGEPSQGDPNEGEVGFKMKPGARRLDSGSAARFFYVPKTSKKDRNEGCESLPLREGGMRSETSGQHLTRRDGGDPAPVNNSHPTVKPTALMCYLIKLVTPPGGVVLDPFFGSGSTGKACILEGFDCIGMEREADYVAIAKARCEHAQITANRLAGVR